VSAARVETVNRVGLNVNRFTWIARLAPHGGAADSAGWRRGGRAGVGYQIGLDTGGTFTDAVLIDDARNVLGKAKALTRHEALLTGLGEALDRVLDATGPNVAAGVTLVSLSTTLATNALVEGRGRAVGLVLIGLDEERLGRARLADALGGDPVICLAGGHDAGGAERMALEEAALGDFVREHDAAVEAWAISGLFATRNPAHERRARDVIGTISDKPTSLGHVLSGGLDAPRRALTALLNARLVPLIGELLVAARELLRTRALDAPLMVVKGDGSLISAEVAAASPVETILSGPAASLVGARFLCDEPELLVADTGGTTTDIARLVEGRPRLAPDGATVGGWRTMVRAVDVRTVALGGDGELRLASGERGGFELGATRVVPLALLTHRHPALLAVLRAQLAAPRASPHDGRFALAFRAPTPAMTARLGSPERDLLDRLANGPVSVATLFAERSRDRALERLARTGLVQLAAFTPSDASQLAGSHPGWTREGAELGARLLMRRAAGDRRSIGTSDENPLSSPEAFAKTACRHVAERVALALADAVVMDEQRHGKVDPAGLTPSQRELVERGFADEGGDGASAFGVSLSLRLPVAGLGAPAASYHAPAARLLKTRALLPLHGDVANALGAVVGRIRQAVCVTIVADGGTRVRVLLAAGPESVDTLEEGVAIAEAEARSRAVALALAAGVGETAVTFSREDDCVDRDGLSVFLESRVTAVASGRPACGAGARDHGAGG